MIRKRVPEPCNGREKLKSALTEFYREFAEITGVEGLEVIG